MDGMTFRCLSIVLSPLAVGFSFLPPLGALLLEMRPTLSPVVEEGCHAVQVVGGRGEGKNTISNDNEAASFWPEESVAEEE